MPLLDDDGDRCELLRAARRIAVVGASSRPGRPSYGVLPVPARPRATSASPVNPNEAEVHGVPSFADVARPSATGPVDIVDVFRRSELCVPHAEEAVAVGARCLWLQLASSTGRPRRIAARGGPDGRHGPLHRDRAPPARARPWAARCGRPDQRIGEPRGTRARTRPTAISAPICAWRLQDLHRHRRAGLRESWTRPRPATPRSGRRCASCSLSAW